MVVNMASRRTLSGLPSRSKCCTVSSYPSAERTRIAFLVYDTVMLAFIVKRSVVITSREPGLAEISDGSS